MDVTMSLLIVIIARDLSIRQKRSQHRLKDVTNESCACGVCGSLWRSGARVQDADRCRLLDVSKRKLKRSLSTTYNYCYIIIAVHNTNAIGGTAARDCTTVADLGFSHRGDVKYIRT